MPVYFGENSRETVEYRADFAEKFSYGRYATYADIFPVLNELEKRCSSLSHVAYALGHIFNDLASLGNIPLQGLYNRAYSLATSNEIDSLPR